MRIQANNVWGKANPTSGFDVQRSDLWIVDFTVAIMNLGASVVDPLVYAEHVKLPDLEIQGEVFKRDSTPFYFPGMDRPVETVDMSFKYAIPVTGQAYSPFYDFLYKWRNRVRAGRGGLSREPQEWVSSKNDYRIDYTWDIPVRLLRGNRPNESEVSEFGLTESIPSLVTSTAHILKNAWLSKLGITDLDYTESARAVSIKATFYCDDILSSLPDDTSYSLELKT